jgi:hypothetical protein
MRLDCVMTPAPTMSLLQPRPSAHPRTCSSRETCDTDCTQPHQLACIRQVATHRVRHTPCSPHTTWQAHTPRGKHTGQVLEDILQYGVLGFLGLYLHALLACSTSRSERQDGTHGKDVQDLLIGAAKAKEAHHLLAHCLAPHRICYRRPGGWSLAR